MKKYKEEYIKREFLDSIVCDICQTEYNYEQDELELQEFISINFTGGYGSIFGDGMNVKLDICQHCLYMLIGGYIKYDA